ncbi:ROK family transcriptional regulator [Halobacillus amylolyticus]|uniref:ROK family protein n=1 Tax=Halobacillus amylolyticus TaxID=2932259 RepID=A0ABY4HAW9_9BACI|nr:ROK family transcriptional regulator [Halobacillus amylolyticus]UOR11433.1 ROK family protein [Halobacillus amylolyticus]
MKVNDDMENRTWNQFTIKNGNKSLVLETIIKHSPISRAEIANKTGLNKGTVSSQVIELLDEELIYEKGPGESSGGRRPVMLLFNQKAGYSIGIDIGVNYILGILTDLEGDICGENSLPLLNSDFDNIIDKLFGIIDSLISYVPASRYSIVGIGIGVPGSVSKFGNILLAPNLGWKEVNLKSLMEAKYDCPVIVENEANAGAYGEKVFGSGINENDIVYVSVGVGIGVGLILNDQLYRGTNGFAGEMGHMTIEVNGTKCRCGNVGCWELYASEQALKSYSQQLGISSELDELDTMILLAEEGCETAIQAFQTLGEYLGVGIINIVNSFNPKQVIIGNRIAKAKKWMEQPLRTKAKNNSLWFQQNDLKIDFSKLTTHSAALGVAAFAFEGFLKSNIPSTLPVSSS